MHSPLTNRISVLTVCVLASLMAGCGDALDTRTDRRGVTAQAPEEQPREVTKASEWTANLTPAEETLEQVRKQLGTLEALADQTGEVRKKINGLKAEAACLEAVVETSKTIDLRFLGVNIREVNLETLGPGPLEVDLVVQCPSSGQTYWVEIKAEGANIKMKQTRKLITAAENFATEHGIRPPEVVLFSPRFVKPRLREAALTNLARNGIDVSKVNLIGDAVSLDQYLRQVGFKPLAESAASVSIPTIVQDPVRIPCAKAPEIPSTPTSPATSKQPLLCDAPSVQPPRSAPVPKRDVRPTGAAWGGTASNVTGRLAADMLITQCMAEAQALANPEIVRGVESSGDFTTLGLAAIQSLLVCPSIIATVSANPNLEPISQEELNARQWEALRRQAQPEASPFRDHKGMAEQAVRFDQCMRRVTDGMCGLLLGPVYPALDSRGFFNHIRRGR